MAERGVIFKDSFVTAPDKSWHDLSFDYLLSMNFGELVPSACVECMPEDVIKAKTDSFARLSPLAAPTFGKCNMFNYHFYVRNRSIWTQWESFISDKDQRKSWQQANPLWTPPEMPYIDIRQVLYNSLFCDPDNMMVEFVEPQAYIDDPSFGSTGLLNPHVYYLLLQPIINETDDTKEIVDFYSLITPDLSLITRDYVDLSDSSGLWYIIPFVPNKTEQKYTNGRYNPFSNGTLFDYLGIDLSGMYEKNLNILDTEFAALTPDGFSGMAFRNYFTSSFTILKFSDYLDGVSMSMYDWIRSHSILGMACLHVDTDERLTSYFFDVNGQIKKSIFKNNTYTRSTESTTEPVLLFEDPAAQPSSLPLRAYWSVYIDYFRDENYISVNPCVDFSRDGNDIDWSQSLSNIFDYLTLQFKAWEHDPYTSALPKPQRGEPVRFLPDSRLTVSDSIIDSATILSSENLRLTDKGLVAVDSSNSGSVSSYRTLDVDLSAATIENLRFASALQSLRETEARSGGRYFELMEAIFGARIDDAKIDRPVYLSGDKSPIQISEVLQTSATQVSDDQPLGQMAGRGVSVASDSFIEYVTPDHGFFIEITAVLPRTNYQSGILPMFRRKVRLDFAIPKFAQLGEQAVPQSELWYCADSSEDDKPLGYQSRYYDMKYLRDRTSGSFKDSLSHWTWSRIFDNAPVIGKRFIEVHPDYRQFAVTNPNDEHVYIHMWHDIQVCRSLPVYGVPTLK